MFPFGGIIKPFSYPLHMNAIFVHFRTARTQRLFFSTYLGILKPFPDAVMKRVKNFDHGTELDNYLGSRIFSVFFWESRR